MVLAAHLAACNAHRNKMHFLSSTFAALPWPICICTCSKIDLQCLQMHLRTVANRFVMFENECIRAACESICTRRESIWSAFESICRANGFVNGPRRLCKDVRTATPRRFGHAADCYQRYRVTDKSCSPSPSKLFWLVTLSACIAREEARRLAQRL